MIGLLSLIDKGLAAEVAFALGLQVPQEAEKPINKSIPADGDPSDYESIQVEGKTKKSEALSMKNTIKDTIKSRKVAILAADGVDATSLKTIMEAVLVEGGIAHVIAPKLGQIKASDKTNISVEESFLTASSVLYDAVYVPGGKNSVATLEAEANAIHFLNEAFKHCKAIAADLGASQVLEATYFFHKLPQEFSEKTVLEEGIVIEKDIKALSKKFIKAIAQHRFWEREKPRQVPA
jgi:catalase